MNQNGSRPLRLFRLAAISAATFLLLAGLVRLEPLVPLTLPSARRLVAWPLLLGGLALLGASAYSLTVFGGASGGPGDPTKSLVVQGPYRYVRNPVYLGGAAVLFGVGLLRPSLPLLALAVLYLPVMHWYVRTFEEPASERRFGAPYRSYLACVPRWFPRLHANHSPSDRSGM